MQGGEGGRPLREKSAQDPRGLPGGRGGREHPPTMDSLCGFRVVWRKGRGGERLAVKEVRTGGEKQVPRAQGAGGP